MDNKIYQFMKKITFFLISLLVLTACNDNNVDPGGEGGGEEDIVIDHGVTFDYPVFVGNIDGDFRRSMDEMFTNIVSTIDENTSLVVLGNLNELDESILKEVYESGREIAIVFPKKADIDRFISQHDWVEAFNTEGADDVVLLSFNNSLGGYVISPEEIELTDITDHELKANDDEDEPEKDPELDPNDLKGSSSGSDSFDDHSDYCILIASWIHSLNSQFDTFENDGDKEDKDKNFFIEKTICDTIKSFSINEKIRKSGAYVDYCSGTGSVSLAFKYNMVHVYQKEQGEGDYYIMKMDASVNNSHMWDGKVKKVNHIGAVTKICGWLLNTFSIRVTLVDSITKNTIPVILATRPLPATGVNTGATEIGQNFSINAGASISGGWDQKDGFNVGGKANVSFGWSWNDQKTWNISECSVGSLEEGNVVGWQARISHFPEWQPYAFKLPDGNQLLTTTAPLQGTWIWKLPATKDNEKGNKYSLKCDIEIEYFARSHVYSKTKDHYATRKFTRYISFPEVINRQTAGGIKLENDFDTEYIYDITVSGVGEDNKNVFETFRSSYKAGETIDLGYYYDKGSYTVSFKARNSGSESPKTYRYSLYDELPMSKGQTITLHAKNDFAEVK